MDPPTPTGSVLVIAVVVALLALVVLVVSAQRSELPDVQPDAGGTTPAPSVLPLGPVQDVLRADAMVGGRHEEEACCGS